jgi:hypothetical protein
LSNLCAVDAQPIPGNAVICHDCTTQVEAALRAVPELMDDLALTFTKRSKVAADSAGQLPDPDAGKPMVYSLAASDAKEHLVRVLLIWARRSRAICRTEITCQPTATALSGWLLQYTNVLRRSEHAAQLHADITGAVQRGYRVIDTNPGKRYVGRCGFTWQGTACTAELWARPDAPEIRCKVCGTVWNVEGRRAGALAAVEHVVQAPEVIARALSSHGMNITAERIYNWRKRGRITPAAADPRTGRARYRLGDVIAVWEAMQASPQNTANRKKDDQ